MAGACKKFKLIWGLRKSRQLCETKERVGPGMERRIEEIDLSGGWGEQEREEGVNTWGKGEEEV